MVFGWNISEIEGNWRIPVGENLILGLGEVSVVPKSFSFQSVRPHSHFEWVRIVVADEEDKGENYFHFLRQQLSLTQPQLKLKLSQARPL